MSGLSLGACDGRDFCRSSIRDSTIGINFDALGEVEHYEHVSGDLFDLLKSDMREAQPGNNEITLQDATPESFRALLEYIYSGKVCLGDLPEQVILDLLGLSNKYDFSHLQSSILAYLKATLSVHNACIIYNVANFYQLSDLCLACASYIDINAQAVMRSEAFLSISHQSLVELVSRTSFYCPELEVYFGIRRWLDNNEVSKDEEKNILKIVRLELIPMSSLLGEVRESSLFEANDILDAIAMINKKNMIELNQRGLLLPEENVATVQHDATVSDNQTILLSGDTESYTGDHGYAIHTITRNGPSKGIIVGLNQPYIINCIKMLLWDRDNRSYSYYIEISLDGSQWLTIIDRRDHLCRSWQELFFEDKVVKYIRIIGTFNSMNRSFHLVSFSCLHTSRRFSLSKDGLIIPDENVASISTSATVLEGVSRSRNALLNGNTRDYDWDSGYTCHQLGSGYIIIQLAQPYVISTMRLLLWDCDDRSYSYYIEVSTDQKSWTKVIDRSQESCRSWQHIQFDPLPVTFVKIVGTHNTANEVFHCVHFECPAAPLSSSPNNHFN
ncbi:PREDICTED: BTB/POZ domain-containing protein 9-like isoform X2 [Amphimedon queenslandica]|uniref:BTB/POZ domain-containing protein 9 n=1 Tax=Amphimedon queenslandica TaxID=400682 RepID=A0A1X7UNM4_AMPQE|nr:PREDICTED: BTB/POZ domain-containing protein 9-like isoform X2 [Amphimedon queenslandica]|eukprot:XP_019853257.1 PREDICTED: BTB/POZ domain-containing protein 9-like isoform X2 [Amphimedon queenslandica]